MVSEPFPAASPRGGVVALGNFDGVHRGHAALIAQARAKADAAGVPLHVVTFEPHPRLFFDATLPPFRLTPTPDKEARLRALGVDAVVTLPFDGDLAAMSAHDFVTRMLIERLDARHVVAGQDFAFGRARGGTMATLTDWLAPFGVGVTAVDPLHDETATLIASTAIRNHLRVGDVAAAARMLGRVWTIDGTVVTGDRRGRTLGFPTANIALGGYLRPQFGVYAVQAGPVGAALDHRGVANIGIRPTVDGLREGLEAHLFDFDRDMYGQDWRFALTQFIRSERRFDTLDALKAQIALDADAARAAPQIEF